MVTRRRSISPPVKASNFLSLADIKKLDPISLPPTDPYGIWRCADGTEVLFDRSYCGIWIKHPDGSVERTADYPDNVVHQELFWCDGPTQPERSWKTQRKLDRLLREWGVR